MKIDRKTLLSELESVVPGLATKEIIEQSNCFVFRNQQVQTFNDEVAVTASTCLDIEGVVPAKPLVALLRKLKEEELAIELSDGELLVKGKGRRAGIRLETEVRLCVDVVEDVEKWKKLPDDFLKALGVVVQCVGTDASFFACTCVHLHPKWMEGSDNYQVIRYPLKTGIEGETLVPRTAIRHVISLGPVEFSETDSWIHFRNKQSVTMSCRRYVEGFPDIGPILDIKGKPITLPKGIDDIVDRATVFGGDSGVEVTPLLVKLRPGWMKLESRGIDGWYAEKQEIKYDGEPMSFTIAPKLLLEVLRRGCECQLADGRLKIDGGDWSYVTCLGAVEDDE